MCASVFALTLLVLLGLALPAGLARAQGAMALTITPGARAEGMGRALVAVPTDASANYWNPAALAFEKGRVFGLMHAQLVPGLADDVYYENLGYATHLPGWGGVGASLVYLGYGKSQGTDIDGTPTVEFTSYEISPQVHIGTELVKGLAAGLSLKYIYVMLAPASANGGVDGVGDTFAADIGVLAHLQEIVPLLPLPVNLGVNVQNLGPNISFSTEDQSDPIGRNLKIGIGAQVLSLPKLTGLLVYDFNQSLRYSSETVHNAGVEVSYANFVSLRGGYIYDKPGDIRDPTFGVGFVVDLGVNSLGFDYASGAQARGLDRVNKLSITFRF
jgi:hypothetical protein